MLANKSLNMKAFLEYNLPKDSAELKHALSGLDALVVLNDLEQECQRFASSNSGAFAGLDRNTIEAVQCCLDKTLINVR